MKIIPLTVKNYSDVNLIIDQDDYDLIKNYNWVPTYRGGNWYALAVHRTGDMQSDKRKKRVMTFIHRLITKCPNGSVVDHINGNGLDNRKENLRICSVKENNYKASQSIAYKTSIYRGVSFTASHKKQWQAGISIDNKRKYLGHYNEAITAAKAFDIVCYYIRGDFSVLNFPNNINEYKEYKKLPTVNDVIQKVKDI